MLLSAKPLRGENVPRNFRVGNVILTFGRYCQANCVGEHLKPIEPELVLW